MDKTSLSRGGLMNKFIKDIIDKNCSDKQKKKELDKLNDEIEMAIGILSGNYFFSNLLF